MKSFSSFCDEVGQFISCFVWIEANCLKRVSGVNILYVTESSFSSSDSFGIGALILVFVR